MRGEIGNPTEQEWRNEIADILANAAVKINTIEEEAKTALSTGDAATYEAKYREKGEELVSLPDRVRALAANLDRDTERRLMLDIDSFAREASNALNEKNPKMMAGLLSYLLSRKGSEIGDKNMLEELADGLRQGQE